jgi:hypothetical protein
VVAVDVRSAHHNMLLALLGNAPPESSPLAVYNGRAPDDATGPYVVAHMTTTRPDGTSITNDQDIAVTRAILICTVAGPRGGDAAAVAVVAGRCDAALLGVTPVIEGRGCWPIRGEPDAPPPGWDDSIGSTVWTQHVVYRFGSIPSDAD